LAYHAPPRDDAAHIGDIVISPGPLRSWNQGNPGMLVQMSSDLGRISDCW